MTAPVLHSKKSGTRMVVALSGANGFIGSEVARSLEQQGHEVRPLVRRAARSPAEISWNPATDFIDTPRLEGVHAVIHLAGETIAQRWTSDVERRVRDSRVNGTRLLASAIASIPRPPAVMLSGSAIGIYGDRGDETLDENSTAGTSFLAAVCQEWEAATKPVSEAGTRVVHLRTGVVLGRRGGALAKLLPSFRLGLGGRLGTGRQWMSWIAIADYTAAVALLLRDVSQAGAFNLVAPNPVTNTEFTRVLGAVLGRPARVVVPRFALKLAMGHMADATVLASQRVRPRKLLETGFNFAFPTLESALRAELGATRSAR